MPDVILFLCLIVFCMIAIISTISFLVGKSNQDATTVSLWIPSISFLIFASLLTWVIIVVQMPLEIEQEQTLDIQNIDVHGLKMQIASYADHDGQIQQLNITRIFNSILPDGYKVKVIIYKKTYGGIYFEKIRHKYQIVPL